MELAGTAELASALARVGGLPEQLAMAREAALLGAYDTALVYFDGVVTGIHKHLRTLVDAADRQRWIKVRTVRACFASRVKPSFRSCCTHRCSCPAPVAAPTA